jgi:ubiquitin carboxyl-terminal hydrolase 7
MNAILQGLYNTEEFRGNIVSSPFQDNSVGAELSNLFRDLLQGTGEAVSTRRFANALNLNVNTQEDAQEFFLRLLNELDDHVISSESEKTQKWRYSGHFRGELLQVINCSYIDFLKTRTQRFLDITVDIDGHSRLEDALGAMFCRPELLTGENKYKAGDFGLQEAEKRVTLAKLPKALCITLKRFRYDINSGGLLKVSCLL